MQGFNDKQLDQLVPIIQKQVKELENADGWVKIADGKVIGYTKKSNSNSVISRAETIIDTPMEKIIQFFIKDDSFQKINDMCILNKLVYEKKGKYKVFYSQMKTPFPLDNRDAVTLSTSINEGNKFYIGVKSCNYPVQKPSNLVRANMKISAWVFEKVDNYRTRVTSFADMDPMGNIPDFVKQKMASRRVEVMQKLQSTLKKNGL